MEGRRNVKRQVDKGKVIATYTKSSEERRERGMASSIAAVQATNDDASASKLSCVKKGYIVDNFVQFFVRRPIKRSPIINRGYYARWASIRKLLLQFLEANSLDSEGPPQEKQILSIGAGFDTTFFQLAVVSKKAAIIASQEVLYSKLGSDPSISKERGEVFSEHYTLLPARLTRPQGLDKAFTKAKLDAGLPTLIIGECVLIYLEPQFSQAVVKWAADKFESAVFVIYEQIHPDDAFGQQMLRNLESRGCPLLGLHDTPTLESKENRFTEQGWQRAMALDMDAVYHQQIDSVDRRRIERLEIFDEFEEWNIMQEHYCVAYGIKDNTTLFDNFGFTKGDHGPSNGKPPII